MSDEYIMSDMLNELRKTADQLEAWADEAKRYGWSTIHVEPMLKRASEIRSVLRRWER